jgi:hypothetical protein
MVIKMIIYLLFILIDDISFAFYLVASLYQQQKTWIHPDFKIGIWH